MLFAVRGKLGDTLIAFATVRRYADRFPEDHVTLLVRASYAPLLARERGVRVIGFDSRLAMLARLARLALEPRFDALLVLWGFGPPVEWLGRWVRADRRIYLDGRFGALFPERAEIPREHLQSEPMWRVARVFEPSLEQPQALSIPSLAARRETGAQAIGIGPVADEPRRVMSAHALGQLVAAAARHHPGAPIRILLNPDDPAARPIIASGAPEGAELRFFPRLDDLVRELAQLAHLYTTDTGLHHLAAAMSVPCTVFYGPTQPWKNAMPAQPDFRRVRVGVLGREHCEVKDCTRPLCLEQAVASFCEGEAAIALADTPGGCPLRMHTREALAAIQVQEAS